MISVKERRVITGNNAVWSLIRKNKYERKTAEVMPYSWREEVSKCPHPPERADPFRGEVSSEVDVN
jgi:hypothetical protein